MTSEIPDGVPPDPHEALIPAEHDYLIAARATKKAYDALVAVGLPASLIDTALVETVAVAAAANAYNRCGTRAGRLLYVPPVPGSEKSPAEKFNDALLAGATDEEIKQIATEARRMLKERRKGEGWKGDDDAA